MAAARWKTVKVPEWAYENVRALQRQLAASGTTALPAHLRDRLRGNNIPGLGELFGIGIVELGSRCKPGKRRP